MSLFSVVKGEVVKAVTASAVISVTGHKTDITSSSHNTIAKTQTQMIYKALYLHLKNHKTKSYHEKVI